jgi:hypothetical protein
MDEQESINKGTPDMELAAMAQLDRIVRTLDAESAVRTVRWLSDRYDRSSPVFRTLNPKSTYVNGVSEVAELADLFSSANPATHDLKALVVGFWFQVIKGAGDLDAQAVNTELKQLGHGLKNITAAFAELISARPQLAIQVRKAGTTKQARKRYRLTNEGLKRVRVMLGEGGVQVD